jgi:hypothetical protein
MIRLAVLVSFALVALPGCVFGSDPSPSEVAEMMNRGLPPQGKFRDLQCTGNATDGWDYVCTYVDRRTGEPKKMGVKKTADGVLNVSDSVYVSEPLPPA